MSRLSLKEAVEALMENGSKVEKEKGLYNVTGKENHKGITGTDVVRLAKMVLSKDMSVHEQQIEDLTKKLEEVKAEMAIRTGPESQIRRQRLLSKHSQMVKQIEELKVAIEAGGNPITPNRIAQVLKTAGFETTETYTTAVRGWHEYGGDFSAKVDECDRHYIFVDVSTSRHRSVSQKVEKVAVALEEAGYKVERVYGGVKINRVNGLS